MVIEKGALQSVSKKDLKGFVSFTTPLNITKLGGRGSVFNNNELVKVIVTGNVNEIGSFAFKNCIELKIIIIEEGVKVIDDYAFNSCLNLNTIILPSSIEKIGKQAFSYCSSKLKIELPRSTAKIVIRSIPEGFRENFCEKRLIINDKPKLDIQGL
ncbi:MAG: leucine-rich repeat domain-containing protein [Clostridia bacterium]|jgi:hypothetical protein|nr:leucine-rich repeat domain-containing protein [Clostridia bacterium]